VGKPGPALEDDAAVLGLDEDEVERLRDRRRRQLAGDHRLEQLEARLACDLLARREAVDDPALPQGGVDGLPFGEEIDGRRDAGFGHEVPPDWVEQLQLQLLNAQGCRHRRRAEGLHQLQAAPAHAARQPAL
jgi:hypothetical protein